MYELNYTNKSYKQLEKLDKHVKKRIITVLEKLKVMPYSLDLKKLVGTNNFRFRVGDYRIILNINNQYLTILVISVNKRENAYD